MMAMPRARPRARQRCSKRLPDLPRSSPLLPTAPARCLYEDALWYPSAPAAETTARPLAPPVHTHTARAQRPCSPGSPRHIATPRVTVTPGTGSGRLLGCCFPCLQPPSFLSRRPAAHRPRFTRRLNENRLSISSCSFLPVVAAQARS